jgi:hypothetical protein
MNLLAQAAAPLGPSYRTIPLTRGFVTIVDAEDYERLNRHKWFAIDNGHGNVYAARKARRAGPHQNITMHNEIMGEPPAPKMTVDHRDPSTSLDNRRSNLRWATKAQQQYNKRLRHDNKTGYTGVYPLRNKFAARLKHDGHSIHVGTFATRELAHDALRARAKQLRGDFA